jgi:hypothetical protein
MELFSIDMQEQYCGQQCINVMPQLPKYAVHRLGYWQRHLLVDAK